jgi:hypothetical protein
MYRNFKERTWKPTWCFLSEKRETRDDETSYTPSPMAESFEQDQIWTEE